MSFTELRENFQPPPCGPVPIVVTWQQPMVYLTIQFWVGVRYDFQCQGALLKDRCLLIYGYVYGKLLPKYQEQHKMLVYKLKSQVMHIFIQSQLGILKVESSRWGRYIKIYIGDLLSSLPSDEDSGSFPTQDNCSGFAWDSINFVHRS